MAKYTPANSAALVTALGVVVGGDEIELTAGVTYTGNFVLPVHSGASYVTIYSGTTIPPSGQRVAPSDATNFAKLQSPDNQPVISTAASAEYWHIYGVEFLPCTNPEYSIIAFGNGDRSVQTSLALTARYLKLDRCYVHGDATNGQLRGLALNSRDAEITECYFSDFKRMGAESQAIGGWNGPGPYLIDNNYLEGSCYNVIFGGSDSAIAALMPQDLTFTNNLCSKPLAWRSQGWQVKNIFELKAMDRATISGNVFENCWADAQNGIAVLFTVRNQDGNAPWSTVSNIDFTDNTIRSAGGVFNILGKDDTPGHDSVTMTNVLIEDNECYDISAATYLGSGRFMLLQAGDSITVNHNTAPDNDGEVSVYLTGVPATNLTWTNNIGVSNGRYFGADSGLNGTAALNAFVTGYSVTNNALIGGSSSGYPSGNFYPANIAAVDFVDVAGDDYELEPTSPYIASATDGGELGVRFGAAPTTLTGTMTVAISVPSFSATGTIVAPPITGTLAAAISVPSFDATGAVSAPGDVAGTMAVAVSVPSVSMSGTVAAPASGGTMVQVIPKVAYNCGYGGATSYIGVHDGLGDISDAIVGGASYMRVPVSSPGTVSRLSLYSEAPAKTSVTVTVQKNGVDTAVTCTLAADATIASDTTHSFTVVAGDDLQYKIVTTQASGHAIAFCLQFESDTGMSVYGIARALLTHDRMGGAFGNGYWEGYSSPSDSGSYSICAVNGAIKRLDLKSMTVTPDTGIFTAYIKLNNVIQDGTGGTVDTSCVMTGAVMSAFSTFTLPCELGDLVDIVILKTGGGSGLALAAGVAFLADGNPDYFMWCGGDNSVVGGYRWTTSEQLAVTEVAHLAPISLDVTALGLYVRRGGVPGTGASVTHTLRRDQVDTAIAVTLENDETTGLIEDTPVAFSAGSLVDLGIVEFDDPTVSQLHWGLYATAGSSPTPFPPPEGTTYATRRERVFALPPTPGNVWMFLRGLELLMQTGMGLSSGQGSDPQVMIQISRDGGHTWSGERWVSAGPQGAYARRVILRNLGRLRSGGYVRIAVSDPVPWYFLDCLAQIDLGVS